MSRQGEARHLVHGTMIAFAVASLGNVREFFNLAGHPDAVAWPLSIALGSSLVILSIMLTHVDRETDKGAWGWLLSTALLLGAISGSIQTHVYQQHLPERWALILGFGLPLCGECLLAVATSAYIKARGRERYRNVSLTVETAVADRLEDAIAAIDAETIQRHVERTVNALAKQAVDSVAAQAVRYYQAESGSSASEAAAPQFGPHNLAKAKTIRARQVQAATEVREETILAYLNQHGPQGTSVLANVLDVHRDTARKLLQTMSDAGQVEYINRQWAMPLT